MYSLRLEARLIKYTDFPFIRSMEAETRVSDQELMCLYTLLIIKC